METHKRFGLRTISLVLFLTLSKSLSSTAFDVSEYEDGESVDIADSFLSYGYVLENPLVNCSKILTFVLFNFWYLIIFFSSLFWG